MIPENDPVHADSLLIEVLNDFENEDFLVPVLSMDGVFMSLRMRPQLILGSMPAEDCELYRLRYGVQARQLLTKRLRKAESRQGLK